MRGSRNKTQMTETDLLNVLLRDSERPTRRDNSPPVWTPHPGQLEALEAFNRRENLLIQAGRRWGKSRTLKELFVVRASQAPTTALMIVPKYRDIIKLRQLLIQDHTPFEWSESTKILRLTDYPDSAIHVYTSTEPEDVRGWGVDLAIYDEVAYWQYPDELLTAIQPTLADRDGQWVAATTPPLHSSNVRGHHALTRLAKNATVIRGATSDNHYLSPSGVEALRREIGGNDLVWRVEWLGEHVTDPPTSLFPERVFSRKRGWSPGEKSMDMVAVGVDPTVGGKSSSDEVGIVVVGRRPNGKYHVLSDDSGLMSPRQWAIQAVMAYRAWNADIMVVEQNQGGEFLEMAIEQEDPDVNVHLVSATRGKVDRAVPVSSVYERGEVVHHGDLAALENQLKFCVPGQTNPAGDDRLDALVHAITWLEAHGQPWDFTAMRLLSELDAEEGDEVDFNSRDDLVVTM